jgi:hypothetical protein
VTIVTIVTKKIRKQNIVQYMPSLKARFEFLKKLLKREGVAVALRPHPLPKKIASRVIRKSDFRPKKTFPNFPPLNLRHPILIFGVQKSSRSLQKRGEQKIAFESFGDSKSSRHLAHELLL